MTLNNNLSIIVQPSLGQAPNQISTGTGSGSGLSYDLSSLDVVSSVPLDQQIIVTSGTTVLNPGTDYYSDGNGNIIVDSQYAGAGTTLLFSRNIDLETFYDDFSDLGAAPSGPAKRRDEQVLFALQDVEERVSSFETGDIEVDLDETRIVASNTVFGPGDIGFFDNNGILITSEANGTGIGFAINYAEALSNPLLISGVEALVSSYLTENPVTAPVDSVAGKTGAVTLVAADLGDFDSAVDARIPAIPTAVSSLTNDAGYVTSSVTIPTSQVTGLDAELGKLPPVGGTTGQVLKKQSGTDYDYVWAADGGGSGSGSISLLSEIGNVETTNLEAGQLLFYNEIDGQWQNFTLDLTTNDISDFTTEVATFIQSGINVTNFVNDADYATNAQVTNAVNAVTYSSINGPTLLSQFSNDSNFQTDTEVSTAVTDGVAGKFDEPTGTPSTGDVIEWSGTEAQWATPSATSGGGIEFWQVDFGTPQEFDGSHGLGDGVVQGTELTNGTFGTYSVGVGDIPTYSFNTAGTYKITANLAVFSTNPFASETFDIKLNGTTITRLGLSSNGPTSFGAQDAAGSISTSKYVTIASSDVVTLDGGTIPTGTWIIEKVG